MTTRNRVDVIHGVNLDMLGRRPAQHYGDLTFDQLEQQISEYCRELDLEARFFQTNHEGDLVEHLHRVKDIADAIVINPGAWTHYAWAIRDALEIAGVPAVEVHLSDVDAREEFRRVSVIRDICIATVKGEGVAGYRTALTAIKEHLDL